MSENTFKPEPMEVMLQRRLAEAEKQIALMRQLGTTQGFIQAWFDKLKVTKTNEEAFDELNELYFKLYGTYRYSCYRSFRSAREYYFKKTKNK
jgi:hypothetical protein